MTSYGASVPVAPAPDPNTEGSAPPTAALPPTVPAPPPHAPTPPRRVRSARRRRRSLLIALVGVILLIAAAAAIVFVVKPGEDSAKSTAATAKSSKAAAAAKADVNAFKIVLPDGWRSGTKQELAEAPGKPLAIVRRDDGKAFVVIRRSGKMPKNVQAFMEKLDGEFGRRFDDFQRQSAKVLEVRAGKAYNYLYIRKQQGTVESVTVVPVARGSFTLNSIVEGGNTNVARQVGRIIVSFDA